MKLSVEIELQPEELPLATELLKVLKQLTQSVRTRNADRLFKASITRAEDPAQLDAAVADINSLIELGNGSEEIVAHFFAAFLEVAFHPDLLARRQSVAHLFYQLLPRLPENVKSRLRERLVTHVIKVLTVPRAFDCNRMEFFSFADCFGIMVKLQYIAVTAAVSTVIAMLHKPETTSAAITMLGKTVEVCAPVLKERCDPNKLNELRAALLKITDDIFRYDITYIEENLGFSRAPGGAGAPAPVPTTAHAGPRIVAPAVTVTRALAPRESFVGHRSTVFAMAYDERNDGIISSGKDGVVIAWSRDGQLRQTIVLNKHYACSMDVNPKHNTLYLCGVAKDAAAPPAILAYALNDKGAWLPRGSLEKPNRLFSCVKSLTQDAGDLFVTGESSKQDGKHSVMLYDASTTPLEKLRPLAVLEEHTDLITCLASYPNGDGIFFSGSRDCSIRMWDKRLGESVGAFGAPQPAGKTSKAHEMMITCLDSYDNMLLSGSLDKFVCAWDLRMLAQNMDKPLRRIAVDTSAILKVMGCSGTPYAVASTLEGTHLVDLDTGKQTLAHAFPDGRKIGRYHDLRWNPARDTLYAAGDEGRLDLYSTVVQAP